MHDNIPDEIVFPLFFCDERPINAFASKDSILSYTCNFPFSNVERHYVFDTTPGPTHNSLAIH